TKRTRRSGPAILTAMRSLCAAVALALVSAGAGAQTTTIHAASVFDGRGRSTPDATVVVQGGKIVRVETGRTASATYDLRGLTLLPGLIDTHVHLDTHFGKDGRAETRGETPQQQIL